MLTELKDKSTLLKEFQELKAYERTQWGDGVAEINQNVHRKWERLSQIKNPVDSLTSTTDHRGAGIPELKDKVEELGHSNKSKTLNSVGWVFKVFATQQKDQI